MPTATEPARISVTMALDSLREQSTATIEAREHYEQQLALRDDLIRDCRAARVPVATIMRITGLSRDRIIKIAAMGRKTYH